MCHDEDYYGRLWVKTTLPEEVKDKVLTLPSFIKQRGHELCYRCASPLDKATLLPAGDYYCRFCIVFGRNRTSQPLYYLPQHPFPPCQPLKWTGQLTPYQQEVSNQLLSALAQGRDSLIHAVTGAGKTEMTYATVAKVLAQGGSVAVVSPRIDICQELYHRFHRDFNCPMVLLHADSEPYRRSPLVIATVHQLFRFYQAFDMIIVDEVDAFPYADNPQLYQAVKNALKPAGFRVFMTATSTDYLDKEVNRGHLQVMRLSRRFHGQPLVVPRTVWLSGLLEQLTANRLPKSLLVHLKKQRQTGYPLLIFFPRIDLGQRFAEVLQSVFPEESVGFVSSQTDQRLDIVGAFRQGEVTILVSTTILERGVTFPFVDVFVLWANHRLYTMSSLVQISGRVGRHLDRPTGELLFFHDGLTKAMQRAISTIKSMNCQGGL